MAMRSTSLTQNSVVAIDREIGSQYDNVKIVAENIDSVTVLGDWLANDPTVAEGLFDISAEVIAVAGIVDKVVAVANDAADIDTIIPYLDEIEIVANNIVNVAAVAVNSANIDIVATNIVDVNTVAANDANITAVAENQANIDAVVANTVNIDTVAENIDNVNTVAGDTVQINEIYNNRVEIYAADDNAAIATAMAAEAEGSADAAQAILTASRNMSVQTGLPGTYVEYDGVLNEVTIPRGLPGTAGLDGRTPQYAFVYNDTTGDIEYELTGYIDSTSAVDEEW